MYFKASMKLLIITKAIVNKRKSKTNKQTNIKPTGNEVPVVFHLGMPN